MFSKREKDAQLNENELHTWFAKNVYFSALFLSLKSNIPEEWNHL